MSFSFVSASTQRFLNDANNPLTAVPFTVVCWVRPSDVTGTKTAWSIVNTGSTTAFWRLDRNAGTNWQFSCNAASTTVSASAGVPATGKWSFIVCRAITATNRRIHVLDTNTGAHANAQETTSRTPASINAMAVGTFNGSTISQYWDGDIAEFWYTATDIWPEGTTMPEGFFRALAYRGPFWHPRIAKDVIEYRGFRASPAVRRSDSTHRGGTEQPFGDIYYGGRPPVIRIWDNLGGDNGRVQAQPPLPMPYIRSPRQEATLLML
jgi:hypothetical protein